MKFGEHLKWIFFKVCHEMKGTDDRPRSGTRSNICLASELSLVGEMKPSVDGQQSCQNSDQNWKQTFLSIFRNSLEEIYLILSSSRRHWDVCTETEICLRTRSGCRSERGQSLSRLSPYLSSQETITDQWNLEGNRNYLLWQNTYLDILLSNCSLICWLIESQMFSELRCTERLLLSYLDKMDNCFFFDVYQLIVVGQFLKLKLSSNTQLIHCTDTGLYGQYLCFSVTTFTCLYILITFAIKWPRVDQHRFHSIIS